jgi:RNA polymerase sigma-70 factor (ECF subfamily)
MAGVILVEQTEKGPVVVYQPESRTWIMAVHKTGMSTKEISILKSIADQGTDQFEAIFLENWPKVYAFLLRLVGDQSEAEDLALETFIRLYRRPPKNQQDLNVGGWLHRVALNLGINALRSWQRRRQYEEKAGRFDLIEKPTTSPAENYDVEEECRVARKILTEMNPRQSQILILRYSGLAYREIAAIMGVEPGSIGPLLVRAEIEFEKRFRASELEV